jgi:hypothetical protein
VHSVSMCEFSNLLASFQIFLQPKLTLLNSRDFRITETKVSDTN